MLGAQKKKDRGDVIVSERGRERESVRLGYATTRTKPYVHARSVYFCRFLESAIRTHCSPVRWHSESFLDSPSWPRTRVGNDTLFPMRMFLCCVMGDK